MRKEIMLSNEEYFSSEFAEREMKIAEEWGGRINTFEYNGHTVILQQCNPEEILEVLRYHNKKDEGVKYHDKDDIERDVPLYDFDKLKRILIDFASNDPQDIMFEEIDNGNNVKIVETFKK